LRRHRNGHCARGDFGDGEVKMDFCFDVIFLILFPIFSAKTVIPSLSMPIVYKDLNFFVQHFPKFVYLFL